MRRRTQGDGGRDAVEDHFCDLVTSALGAPCLLLVQAPVPQTRIGASAPEQGLVDAIGAAAPGPSPGWQHMTLRGHSVHFHRLCGEGLLPLGHLVLIDPAQAPEEHPMSETIVASATEHLEVCRLRGRNAFLEEELRTMDRAERTLVESTSRLRAIVDAAPVMVWLRDIDGRFVIVNARFESTFDVDREDARGKSPDEIVDEELAQVMDDYHHEALSAPGSIQFELVIGAESEARTFLSETFTLPGADGQPYAVCTIATDISARKKFEEELRASERNYREIFNKVHDAIFVHDFETGRILEVNDRVLEMYRLSPEQTENLNVSHFSAGDPSLAQARAEALVQTARERPVSFEWHARRTDGTEFWAEVHLKHAVISGEDRILAFARDITQRRRDERHRRRLEEQLREAQRLEALGRLSGGISLEFERMVGKVLEEAEHLAPRISDDAAPTLSELRAAAERASELTRRLRVLGGRGVARPEILSFDAALRNLEPLIRASLGTGVEFELRTTTSLPDVWIDPTQLDQVIINLTNHTAESLTGAQKLSLSTDVLRFERREGPLSPGEYVVLRASGARRTELPISRALDTFFATEPEATELGLAMTYAIVHGAGGALRVSSCDDDGATIEVLLPAHGGARAGDDAGEKSDSSSTILVVEDEEGVLKAVVRILQLRNFNILPAASAEEALEVLEDFGRPVDLLLTDIVMPGKSGLDLADELRAKHPDTPILFMSGYTDSVVSYENLISGDADLILKPFTAEKLLQVVDRQLTVKC